jgi:hypothetical protein
VVTGGGDTQVKSTTNTSHVLLIDQEEGVQTNGLNADLLRSEIQFWQGMIESLDDDKCSRESVERMHQALALAEYRLASLEAKELPAIWPQRQY